MFETRWNKFINFEIEEMTKIWKMDSRDIFKCFSKIGFTSQNLNKIKDLRTRGMVYEVFCLFHEGINQDEMVDDIYQIMQNIHESKEKGYLVEKKVLLKLKKLQKDMAKNLCIPEDDEIDYLLYKIAFIMARRLFFIQPVGMEFEAYKEVEVSLFLNQVTTDIISYSNTCAITLKKDVEIKEDHLKSFILRSVKTYSNLKKKTIDFKLNKVGAKTIYFIRTNFSHVLFVHFYSRISLCPPQVLLWKNIGLSGGFHYLNRRRIIEPNIYNKKVEVIEGIKDFVNIQNNLAFYLDKEMIEMQRPRIAKQLQKDKTTNKIWGDYLSEIKDLTEEELNELLNLKAYTDKIKKNYFYKDIDNASELEKTKDALSKTKDEEKIKKLENKEKFLNQQLKKNKLTWSPKLQNKWLQRDFSHSFVIKIYLEFIEFWRDYDGPMYFSTYFDFRGRYYYNSMVSPAQGWPFRFIYNFGDPSQNENKIVGILKNEKHLPTIEKIEEKIGKLDEKNKNSLLWILISIGSITIKKRETIKEEEFIEEGLKNYLEKKEVDDNLENSELCYYYLIIDKLNHPDKKNRYIIKDISGSIFQNGALILGIKNENALKILNLDGEDWHDPYHPIINEVGGVVSKDVLKFFIRGPLKKPIMTRYYSAKLMTSFKYFIQEAEKVDGYYENISIQLFNEFKKVYNHLDKLEKELLFKNSGSDYKKHLKDSKIEKIVYDDFCFNITCYKLVANRIDIEVNGKRLSITNYKESKILHKQKTENSMLPNIFHGEDSNRARTIVKLLNEKNQKCFTIHDAFGVSHENVEDLIIQANNSFNINMVREFYKDKNNVGKKLFCKFIIL